MSVCEKKMVDRKTDNEIDKNFNALSTIKRLLPCQLCNSQEGEEEREEEKDDDKGRRGQERSVSIMHQQRVTGERKEAP